MKNTVMIMMATYNGEHYLRKQLESIQNQTWSEWQLYIQDDGSTDGTYSILQEYADADPRIHIRRNPEKIHGSFTNFHILSNYCKTLKKCAYYCFADQDDVWFPKKLETMIIAFRGIPSDKAALVYADMASRMKRCREREEDREKLSDAQLQKNIRKIDKERASHRASFSD